MEASYDTTDLGDDVQIMMMEIDQQQQTQRTPPRSKIPLLVILVVSLLVVLPYLTILQKTTTKSKEITLGGSGGGGGGGKCNDTNAVVYIIGDSLMERQFTYLCESHGMSEIEYIDCQSDDDHCKDKPDRSCQVGNIFFIYTNYQLRLDIQEEKILSSLYDTFQKQPTHVYFDSSFHMLWRLSPEWDQTKWDSHLLIEDVELQLQARLEFLNMNTYQLWRNAEQVLEEFLQEVESYGMDKKIGTTYMTPHWMCEEKYFEAKYLHELVGSEHCQSVFQNKYPKHSPEDGKQYCNDGTFLNSGIDKLNQRMLEALPEWVTIVDTYKLTFENCAAAIGNGDGRHYDKSILTLELERFFQVLSPGCQSPFV